MLQGCRRHPTPNRARIEATRCADRASGESVRMRGASPSGNVGLPRLVVGCTLKGVGSVGDPTSDRARRHRPGSDDVGSRRGRHMSFVRGRTKQLLALQVALALLFAALGDGGGATRQCRFPRSKWLDRVPERLRHLRDAIRWKRSTYEPDGCGAGSLRRSRVLARRHEAGVRPCPSGSIGGVDRNIHAGCHSHRSPGSRM